MTVETNNYMIVIATFCDWLKHLTPVFNQQDAEQKPIALRMDDFSCVLNKLQVITRNSNWFIAWFVPVVIGHSN